MRAAQNRAMQQMTHEQVKIYSDAFNRSMISGTGITGMVMDEADTVRWSNISNPKEWMK
jgi:hypothetical protein